MQIFRLTLLVVLVLAAAGLVIGGRALFRARRDRLQVEARQREAEFLRANTPRRPPV
jgi:cell division protein FtsL